MGDYADLLNAQTKPKAAPTKRDDQPVAMDTADPQSVRMAGFLAPGDPDVPNEPAQAIEPTNYPTTNRTTERPNDIQLHPRNEETNERSIKRTSERLNIRTKIRHTFDILSDQLLSLRQIALERETVFGERVLLGDLVQEALDMFITKERNTE